MSEELTKSSIKIKFVPGTLFFTAPASAWLGGQIFINGKQMGEGRAKIFTPEEISILNKIVTDASIRHIENLNN